MKRALKINPKDNVAMVLESVNAGDQVKIGEEEITAITNIPMPHKMALTDIKIDEIVYKYGAPIGYATVPIKRGEHVHSHNLDLARMLKALTDKQTIS